MGFDSRGPARAVIKALDVVEDRGAGFGPGGDGAAGGLGLDREFFESLLVPQIMLRGFLGFTPTADGCRIEPKLPTAFPSLTLNRIRIKGLILSVTATADAITVRKVEGESGGLFTITAPGFQPHPPIDWAETADVRLVR